MHTFDRALIGTPSICVHRFMTLLVIVLHSFGTMSEIKKALIRTRSVFYLDFGMSDHARRDHVRKPTFISLSPQPSSQESASVPSSLSFLSMACYSFLSFFPRCCSITFSAPPPVSYNSAENLLGVPFSTSSLDFCVARFMAPKLTRNPPHHFRTAAHQQFLL